MTAGQKARAKLDQWELTEAWLKHTARIFGNILGAPEPKDAMELVDTAFKAHILDGMTETLNNTTPLLQFFEEAT